MLLTTCLDAGESAWQSAGGGHRAERDEEGWRVEMKKTQTKTDRKKQRNKRWLVIKCAKWSDGMNSTNIKYVAVSRVWMSSRGGSGVFKRRKQQV